MSQNPFPPDQPKISDPIHRIRLTNHSTSAGTVSGVSARWDNVGACPSPLITGALEGTIPEDEDSRRLWWVAWRQIATLLRYRRLRRVHLFQRRGQWLRLPLRLHRRAAGSQPNRDLQNGSHSSRRDRPIFRWPGISVERQIRHERSRHLACQQCRHPGAVRHWSGRRSPRVCHSSGQGHRTDILVLSACFSSSASVQQRRQHRLPARLGVHRCQAMYTGVGVKVGVNEMPDSVCASMLGWIATSA